jgi:hypothetical protein
LRLVFLRFRIDATRDGDHTEEQHEDTGLKMLDCHKSPELAQKTIVVFEVVQSICS